MQFTCPAHETLNECTDVSPDCAKWLAEITQGAPVKRCLPTGQDPFTVSDLADVSPLREVTDPNPALCYALYRKGDVLTVVVQGDYVKGPYRIDMHVSGWTIPPIPGKPPATTPTKVYVQNKLEGDATWLFFGEHEFAGSEACSSAPLPGFEFGDDFESARDAFATYMHTPTWRVDGSTDIAGAKFAAQVMRCKSIEDAVFVTGHAVKQHYRLVRATPMLDRLLTVMGDDNGCTFAATIEQRIDAEDAIGRIACEDDAIFCDRCFEADELRDEDWRTDLNSIYWFIATGEASKVEAKLGGVLGFAELQAALDGIFEG